MELVVKCIAGFILGSIPVGYLIARFSGVNIRDFGSGNTGATNVLRALGKKAGYLTFFLDAVKGLPVLIISQNRNLGQTELSIIAFFVVLGHCLSPFLKGKGGKGVATGFGSFCYLFPVGALLSISIFFIVFFISRFVSLASITAVVTFPLFCFLFHQSDYLIFSILTVSLIVIRHSSNISNLLSGKEHKFARSR
ncbi:MAG TPA: glycerol-3-phosphate 1-O-acyltransferase PlsY [Oligoflexia bacterium]|nr:glycerol-3-phosphate 1-O-acyltransferase PlsY [Oligoflexia bacterium]HMP48265.1 glycerol-3-phosphate 1-O-acyltransferase PlsY [Oligoflexia bacterium]